jgi:hypothetical protein
VVNGEVSVVGNWSVWEEYLLEDESACEMMRCTTRHFLSVVLLPIPVGSFVIERRVPFPYSCSAGNQD